MSIPPRPVSVAEDPDPALPASWYQVTLSAIGDAVLTTDPEGRITYMNPVAESLTRWAASDALGRPLEDILRIVNEQTREPIDQPIRKVIEKGLVRGLANRTVLIARDGTETPIDDSAAPVRDEAGSLVGVVMVFRDISERKEAERVAAAARAFAESIVDTIREPLLVLDADLRVASANRSFYDAFDVARGETEGRLVYELGNGQWDIPRLRTALEEILPGHGSFQDFEVNHTFEGIGPRRMLLNGRRVRGPEDDSQLILLAIEDITEHWRAGVPFVDSRERYRVIVEAATSYAIFTVDMQGVVTTWNAGAEKMLGFSEAEMAGRDFRIIFTPEDIEAGQPEAEMRAAEAEGQALDERWHLKKGGESFWANGLLMPLKDDAGQTRGFLKVVRDMTEQKNLEEALRRRTADLERADVQKNQFLAMLAHELRNPLAAIRNAVTVSALSGSVEHLEWSREVITRQVRNFAHLIDDLLDVARITEGKIQLRKELTDATPIIRNAIEAVKPLIEERNHELMLSVTSNDLRLEADPVRLEQILVNLLTNAAKYTPAGGRIHLIAGVEGMEVLLRVRDNGVGIPPDSLTRMFDLFAQGDRSLGRSEGGLGIGLTLVKSLTELHGGTVTAASDGPNRGSEFVVRLPATTDTAPVPPESTAGPLGTATRHSRVLVVDDSKDTADGMARILKLSGHDVRVAYNGTNAIAVAREHRPEVVLLDIGLPGMDGYEVAARLRREECCKEARIIAVSGYGEEQARHRSEEAGIDHHLVKPVSITELFSLLERS
jgi:PAS domain S-box-containing protein